MRTTCLLTVSQHALLGGVPTRGGTCPGGGLGGVPAGGVPAWGVPARGYTWGGEMVYLPGGVPARRVYLPGGYTLPGTPPHGQNSWHTLLKILPVGRGVYLPGGVPARRVYLPRYSPHGQNSWHTLLKILPCSNFVVGGKNTIIVNYQ